MVFDGLGVGSLVVFRTGREFDQSILPPVDRKRAAGLEGVVRIGRTDVRSVLSVGPQYQYAFVTEIQITERLAGEPVVVLGSKFSDPIARLELQKVSIIAEFERGSTVDRPLDSGCDEPVEPLVRAKTTITTTPMTRYANRGPPSLLARVNETTSVATAVTIPTLPDLMMIATQMESRDIEQIATYDRGFEAFDVTVVPYRA